MAKQRWKKQPAKQPPKKRTIKRMVAVDTETIDVGKATTSSGPGHTEKYDREALRQASKPLAFANRQLAAGLSPGTVKRKRAPYTTGEPLPSPDVLCEQIATDLHDALKEIHALGNMLRHDTDVKSPTSWTDAELAGVLLSQLWRYYDAGGKGRAFDCAMLEAARDILQLPIPPIDVVDRPSDAALLAEVGRRRALRSRQLSERIVESAAPAVSGTWREQYNNIGASPTHRDRVMAQIDTAKSLGAQPQADYPPRDLGEQLAVPGETVARGRTKQISPAALAALGSIDLEFRKDSTARAVITAGQLERKVYVEVNAALEAIGGEWQKKLKGHFFASFDEVRERLESLVITGSFIKPTDVNQQLGWVPTPPAVVARMHQLAGIDTLPAAGTRILEPSAGEGALLAGLYRYQLAVVAVEIDRMRAAKLRQFATATAATAWSLKVIEGDFLLSHDVAGLGQFDVVIMNPPFQNQADLDHVRRAFEHLKPGGRLVAIMSSGITFRKNAKTLAFVKEVLRYGGVIEYLPPDTFKESGIGVRAVIVQLDKP